MKDTKIILLKREEVTVIEGAHIASVDLGHGVLVAVFSLKKKIASLLFLPTTALAAERLITETIRRIKSTEANDLQAKLVGVTTSSHIMLARKLLNEAKIIVTGEDTQGSHKREVFFYTDSGRLRVTAEKNKADSEHRSTPPPLPLPKLSQEQLGKKKVLIVDDSKTIRDLLTRILNEDAELEVVGAAANPIEADQLLKSISPDVMTLDIEMPIMDGVTYLEKLLEKSPLPVVMISSLDLEAGSLVLRALDLGAVDYIQKPTFDELKDLAPIIREKVKMATRARVRRAGKTLPQRRLVRSAQNLNRSTIIAIGASTGGTRALSQFLAQLPDEIPPIVVVQHIPPVFSRAFAMRLNETCPFEVKEAEDGDMVQANRVLVAPGGKQMAIQPTSGGFKVCVTDDLPVNKHKPSVDFLFESVAKYVGKQAIGIIMTGMGTDGAKNLLKMKEAGARTVAQDEATCAVFGMPKEAIRIGAAQEVRPLEEIAETVLQWLQQANAA